MSVVKLKERMKKHFDDGKTWENEVFANMHQSRNRAWALAFFSMTLAVLSLVCLALLLPLKTFSPYVVTVDRQSGYVEVTKGLYAGRIPVSGSADARVKKVTYHENDVYVLKGHYGYTTVVEFGDKETIETISLGDSEAWQVVKPHRSNILFVKPLEQNASTNMTVITSAHIYSFELAAEKTDTGENTDLTFRLKFAYNEEADNKGIISFKDKNSSTPLSSVSPDKWNFEYTFTGDNALRPQRVFDDGKFTYFQFDSLDVMPAVFLVDEKGKESIVNSSIAGSNLVVHRLGAQFKLRDGDLSTLIFNEAWVKPEGKERSVVPVTALKERSDKPKSAQKKKRSHKYSFFSSLESSDKIVYNK